MKWKWGALFLLAAVAVACADEHFFGPAARQPERWLVSYVYHTSSHDGVAGYGSIVVAAPFDLNEVMSRAMEAEDVAQPASRGQLVSISPLAVSLLPAANDMR